MGDSDDEHDRRRGGRDKFRQERNDYQGPGSERRPWQGGDRGGGWNQNKFQSRGYAGNRDNYQNRDLNYQNRGYGRRGDDRGNMSPPQKRFRNDSWGEGNYNQYQRAGWTSYQSNYQHQSDSHQGRDNHGHDPDYPTQPPMMTFKQFLASQDDAIDDEESVKKYNEYKFEFKKQQMSEFFLAHKEEEWFRSKYHPDEYNTRKETVKLYLKNRLKTFNWLLEHKWLDDITLDIENSETITKVLDAAVILMEGGTELDLKILDEKEEELETGKVKCENSKMQKAPRDSTEKEHGDPRDKEEGELEDTKADTSDEGRDEKPKRVPSPEECWDSEVPVPEDTVAEEKQDSETPEKLNATNTESTSKSPSPETENMQQDNKDGSSADSDSDAEPEATRDIKKQGVNKDDENGSDEKKDEGKDEGKDESKEENKEESQDESIDDSKEETKEDSNTDDVKNTKNELDATCTENSNEKPDDCMEAKEKANKSDNKIEEEVPKTTPDCRPLHKTSSIFLRNLAPSITKAEIETVAKRFPGFKRLALADPTAERKFYRRGWLTYDRTVNIKEICWNLNNIRLRDCEMGAIVNRDLQRRIRSIVGCTAHRTVVKNDIKIAAKMTKHLDDITGVWDEDNTEKKETEPCEESFGFVSRNPLLKNITDYLVDEMSAEEEELLGSSMMDDFDEKKDDKNSDCIDRDEKLIQVLDKLIFYLRIVHSIDYYNASEYPNEDEMPNRCGLMHARGIFSSSKEGDINDWVTRFEHKIQPFLTMRLELTEEESLKMGKKNEETELEKFIQANTQELAKDKWLCPLSGKKFKGPEFVRKHITNKHQEKLEEVKKDVVYFNNYISDPKRSMLPEHPGGAQAAIEKYSHITQSSQQQPQYHPPPAAQYQQPYHQQQPQPPRYQPYPEHHNQGGYNRGPGYQNRGYDNNYSRGVGDRGGMHDRHRSDPGYNRSSYGGGRGGRGGGGFGRGGGDRDPRELITYRDLDAPDDMDIF